MSNYKQSMKKYIILYILILVTNICLSQNSIVGDSFGGRLWYKPTNISSYSYGGFMICGTERKLYGWGYSMTGLIKRGWRSVITSPTWAYSLSEVKYHSLLLKKMVAYGSHLRQIL